MKSDPRRWLVLAAVAFVPVAAAADAPSPSMEEMHQKHMMKQGGDSAHAGHGAAAAPKMPGQDAFGTIQEIVRILEADPTTDWSKVDLEALRRHLVDMNEVTLNATAIAKHIDNGIEVTVTGSGRTVESIQRMVVAHAHEIDGTQGWSARSEIVANGARLTVTSNDPKEVAHIRGLGFIGVMAEGSHHQHHHLAIARGEALHAH